jgi:nitroreductase
MDSSDFFSFLNSRSSVRQYLDEAIRDEEITYLMDCAITAPSAGNLEAWDVIMIRDAIRKEELSDAALGQTHVKEAPLLMVICANYIRSMSRYGERGILYAVQDATIAGTYLMLAAHAIRLKTCWVGAFDEDEVKSLLGLPAHIRPVAILCIGKGSYTGEMTERMPVAEHLHLETW